MHRQLLSLLLQHLLHCVEIFVARFNRNDASIMFAVAASEFIDCLFRLRAN